MSTPIREPRTSRPRRPRRTLLGITLALGGAGALIAASSLGRASVQPGRGPSLLGSTATGQLYSRALSGVLDRLQVSIQASTELFEDHSSWQDPWRVGTDHYVVQTTQSRYFAVDVARGLEVLMGEFQDLLGTDYAPNPPFEIHVHPTMESYNNYGDTHGEHHSSMYGSFYARGVEPRPVVAVWDDNPTRLRMAITHSASLQFVENAFGRQPPTWIHMGLASYFELYFWDWGWAVEQFDQARDRRALIPLRRLLPATIDQYGTEATARFRQLGMLFAYLLHFNEATRGTEGEVGTFSEYLRAVVRGEDARGTEFQRVITEEMRELEEGFWGFEFPK